MARRAGNRSALIESEYDVVETSSEERNLSASKDKGQLASTTALSITNVALLAKIIAVGSEGTRYFVPALALTGVSLGLLVLAALISMHNAQTRDYYKRYKDDQCADCWSFLCHCRCRGKKRQGSTCRSCLPFRCSCRVTDDFEKAALKDYDTSKEGVARAELELIFLEHEECIECKQGTTETCNDDKCECKGCQLHKCKCKLAEHPLKTKYMAAIRENWVMKRVTFWQNIINYLLYIVAILNTFVAALGLLSDEE